MKRFMLLHFGFKKPTPEVMEAWGKWFESIADKAVEHGGFHGERKEISTEGSVDLPMDIDAITGYSIIEANDMKEAESIAHANPFVASIRVYEIVTQ